MRPTSPKTRAEFVIGTTEIIGRAVTPAPQRADVRPFTNKSVQDEIRSIADSYGVSEPTIHVWDMDVANGFVLGTPNNTIIVISSALVTLLSEAELVAVLAHELAHTANHHTAKLSCLLLVSVLLGIIVGLAAEERWCRKGGTAAMSAVYIVEGLTLLALTRRAEAEADAMAMEEVEQVVFDNALQKIIQAGRDEYPERGLLDSIAATHPAYDERANDTED